MSDYAGKTFKLNQKAQDSIQGEVVPGAVYRVEGDWKELTGKSWRDSRGNPAAMQYQFRNAIGGLPQDDRVLYGKIGSLGHLVHVLELGDEVTDA
jgi:hypothetical protein